MKEITGNRNSATGSHVHYYFQFAGEAKALTEFKQWIKPQLNPSQRILDIHEDRPELGSALNRAERYLGLSSTLVILISGVAIAMATRRYTSVILMPLLYCAAWAVNRMKYSGFIAVSLLS